MQVQAMWSVVGWAGVCGGEGPRMLECFAGCKVFTAIYLVAECITSHLVGVHIYIHIYMYVFMCTFWPL